LGLKISHFWGQSPWWFATLSKNKKVQLIADYRIRNETQKEYEARKKMYNTQEINKRIERQRVRHANENKIR
tara:strand:- start:1230 stop:1445 length:216 start_codon:yes stop_codon:yes gene_type:complete